MASRGGNRSSGRERKPRVFVFDPQVPAQMYKSRNLEDFVRSAGDAAWKKYTEELAGYKRRLREEFYTKWAQDNGVENVSFQEMDKDGPAKKAFLEQSRSPKGGYKLAIQQFRYDFVKDLGDAVMPLQNATDMDSPASARSSSPSRHVPAGEQSMNAAGLVGAVNTGRIRGNIDRHLVNEKFQDLQDPLDYLEWFRGTDWAKWTMTGLQQVMRNFNIPGVSKIPRAEEKQKVYNEIARFLAGEIKVPYFYNTGATGTTSTARTSRGTLTQPSNIAGLKEELARRGITGYEGLLSLTKPRLEELNTMFGLGIPRSLNVGPYKQRIAELAGFQAPMESQQVLQEYNNIVGMNDIAAARRRAAALGEAGLSQLSNDQLQHLSTMFNLRAEVPNARGNLARNRIIGLILQRPTSRDVREAQKESILSNTQSCEQANLSQVQEQARRLGISTYGLSKQELCREINAKYMLNVSEQFLRRAGPTGDIRTIANLPSEQQAGPSRALAQNLGLRGRFLNLGDVLREWVQTHYGGIAASLYPRYRQDVERYIATGELPQNEDALNALANIFSDIDNVNLNGENPEAGLETLYNNFIHPMMEGNVQTFLQNQPNFSLRRNNLGGGRLTSRERQSPVLNNNINVSPRRSPTGSLGASSPRSPINQSGNASPLSGGNVSEEGEGLYNF